MNKKILLSVIALLLAGGAAYFFFAPSLTLPTRERETNNKISPAVMQNNIEHLGETTYKKKLYEPLIAVYEKMLKNYPDNLEIKKKLAFAYFGAEKFEEAKPILEEVSKTALADAEVLRELEFIKNLKSAK